MQRKALLPGLLYLLVVPCSARADNDSASVQTLAIGGKVGVNAVTRGGEGADGLVVKTSYKSSFAAGGFVNVPLSSWFAVQPEILFMMKGASREADGLDRGSYNINYIEVPLLMHSRYPLRGTVDLYGLLGPEVSFLINAEIENENGETLNLDDDVRLIDVGLILGSGVAWKFSRNDAFVFDVRYDLGLQSIFRDDNLDVKNRALSFMAGYQWGLGSR